MKRFRILALAAALSLGAVGITATAASAQTAVLDFGECAFGEGTATVPAGEPITITDTGGFAQGTYGLALHGFKSLVATATIAVTGGMTTTIPLAPSAPQYFGDPYFAWLVFLPDISLDPLASGESVLVTIETTSTVPGEAVFPRQKGPAPHFGPFHLSAGETFEAHCLITAN